MPITLLGTSLSNNVTIGVSSVNGDVDARNTNNADSFSYEFLAAQNFASSTVKLELQLDDYGSETSWEIVNSEGIVLYSGDSYEDIENPAVKNLPSTYLIILAILLKFMIPMEMVFAVIMVMDIINLQLIQV